MLRQVATLNVYVTPFTNPVTQSLAMYKGHCHHQRF